MLENSFVLKKYAKGRRKNYSYLQSEGCLTLCSILPASSSFDCQHHDYERFVSLGWRPVRQSQQAGCWECKTKAHLHSCSVHHRPRQWVRKGKACGRIKEASGLCSVVIMFCERTPAHSGSHLAETRLSLYDRGSGKQPDLMIRKRGQNRETGTSQEGILPLVHCWDYTEPVFLRC